MFCAVFNFQTRSKVKSEKVYHIYPKTKIGQKPLFIYNTNQNSLLFSGYIVISVILTPPLSENNILIHIMYHFQQNTHIFVPSLTPHHLQ